MSMSFDDFVAAFEPLGSKLLVHYDDTKNSVSSGGIIMPNCARNYQREGVVLAVGPGAVLEDGTPVPRQTAVGDLVLFNVYGAQPVPGYKSLLVMDETAVECVLEPVAA